jgi:hypothetical protein
MADDAEGEDWDEDMVMDLRRFALEQALIAHIHKRDTPIDPGALFVLADRFVNYVLGDQTP